MAGSKESCAATDEEGTNFRVKHASEREAWVLSNARALGMQGLFAEAFVVHKAARNQLRDVQGRTYRYSTELSDPTGTNCLLAAPLLGQDAPTDAMMYIDVKIGRNTKSGTQLRLETNSTNFWGKAWVMTETGRHDALDNWRGNRKYGFDYSNELEDKVKALTQHDRDTFLGKLAEEVGSLSTAYKGNKGITFVGTSVLLAINRTKHTCCARLIDPDHPILNSKDNSLAPFPPTLMTPTTYGQAEIGEASTLWNTYWGKWSTGFSQGLANLAGYLQTKAPNGAEPRDIEDQLQYVPRLVID